MSERPEPAGRTILVIQGHPDAGGGHLCHALADAYAQGAGAAGHRVLVVNVATLGFPLVRSQADFLRGAAPAELAEARGALLEAEHVALFWAWRACARCAPPCWDRSRARAPAGARAGSRPCAPWAPRHGKGLSASRHAAKSLPMRWKIRGVMTPFS